MKPVKYIGRTQCIAKGFSWKCGQIRELPDEVTDQLLTNADFRLEVIANVDKEDIEAETVKIEDLLGQAQEELLQGAPYSCPLECGNGGPWKTEKGFKDHMNDKHGITI